MLPDPTVPRPRLMTCIGCGAGTRRVRAIVWTGEHFVMVAWAVTMMHGPYCVSCVGTELNRLHALGTDLGWPKGGPDAPD